jgi:glycosyltransferase involved in cell wall biosynthesis
VCIPIWNRSDIVAASLRSLNRGLAGTEAQIFLFDNGSDIETRDIIYELSNSEHKSFKIFLPGNYGIPYVVNTFRAFVAQQCDYINQPRPDFVMLMDADAYFTKPIRPLLDILTDSYKVAVISGHDSFEHKEISRHIFHVGFEDIEVKIKLTERMLCLVMRREEFESFDTFPTYRNRDVDWEIFFWNRNSLAVRRRNLVVVDWVIHLGQFDRTWDSNTLPASIDEIEKIESALEQEGLLTTARKDAANWQRHELENDQSVDVMMEKVSNGALYYDQLRKTFLNINTIPYEKIDEPMLSEILEAIGQLEQATQKYYQRIME